LIGTTRWAYGKLLAGNLLADLSKVETLDLSKDYFSQTVRELLTFDGRTFAFSADFDAHLYTQAIMYYNARIWEELGLPDPYQLVRDGEWTWEKCLEYANMALRDYDGNGIVDSESDRWGMVAGNGDLINSMYASMDGKFYDKNQYGALKLDCLDAESAEKLAFIYKFYHLFFGESNNFSTFTILFTR
jgi:ABC-type glycerol-3-phosphate transport system substrate-binding protein